MRTSPGSGHALGLKIIIHYIIICLLLVAAVVLPLLPPTPGGSQVSVPSPMVAVTVRPNSHTIISTLRSIRTLLH